MLLQIDSKQEVKWATVLFTPDIDDIIYCSEGKSDLNFHTIFVIGMKI